MNKSNVDELITFDGVKVGAIEPTTIHNLDGTIVANEDFKLNVQTLSNHGWKLQQDLPIKNYKNNDVGSQIQKNIRAAIKDYLDNGKFTYKSKLITGKELNQMLTDVTGNLSDYGFKNLISKIGIDENGKINDVKRFYKSLIAELRTRGGSDNVIAALEAETVLFGVPQTTGKLLQIFASMINKAAVKVQTNGGSFIQMAEFGISAQNLTGGKTGIRLNPNIEHLNPPIINRIVNEDGSITESVTPGSVFIPASFIAKYIPNWKSFSDYE